MRKKLRFLLLGLMLFSIVLLFGCSSTSPAPQESTSGSITGVVKLNDTLQKGVTVSILELDRETTTDAQGVYNFLEVPNGTYELCFEFNQEVVQYTKTESAVINGDEIIVDCELAPSDENSLEAAQDFVEDLNDNNIRMINTVTTEAQEVSAHLQGEVSNYLKNISPKLGYIGNVLRLWIDEGGLIVPGSYTYDPENGLVQVKEYETDPDVVDTWKWDFELTNYYLNDTKDTVSITLSNLHQIITYNNDGSRIDSIDLRQGDFHYSQIMDNDPDLFNFEIDFDLSSSSSQNVQSTGYDSSSGESYKYDLIIPDIAQINVNGILTDNVIFNLDGQKYGPVENAAVEGTLDFNLNNTSDNNHFTFNGSFTSEELSFDGLLDVEFFTLPDYDNTALEQYFGDNVSKIEIDGSMETDMVTLNGGFIFEFLDADEKERFEERIIISYVNIHGGIEFREVNETDEVVGTINLDGDLSIKPDYSTRTSLVSAPDESNYTRGVVSFTGEYSSTGFNPLQLKIEAEKIGYGDIDGCVMYMFGKGKFININVERIDNLIKIRGSNEESIKLYAEYDLNSNYYDSKTDIGDITNFDGTEQYGDIIYGEGQFNVNWEDGTTNSLLY